MNKRDLYIDELEEDIDDYPFENDDRQDTSMPGENQDTNHLQQLPLDEEDSSYYSSLKKQVSGEDEDNENEKENEEDEQQERETSDDKSNTVSASSETKPLAGMSKNKLRKLKAKEKKKSKDKMSTTATTSAPGSKMKKKEYKRISIPMIDEATFANESSSSSRPLPNGICGIVSLLWTSNDNKITEIEVKDILFSEIIPQRTAGYNPEELRKERDNLISQGINTRNSNKIRIVFLSQRRQNQSSMADILENDANNSIGDGIDNNDETNMDNSCLLDDNEISINDVVELWGVIPSEQVSLHPSGSTSPFDHNWNIYIRKRFPKLHSPVSFRITKLIDKSKKGSTQPVYSNESKLLYIDSSSAASTVSSTSNDNGDNSRSSTANTELKNIEPKPATTKIAKNDEDNEKYHYTKFADLQDGVANIYGVVISMVMPRKTSGFDKKMDLFVIDPSIVKGDGDWNPVKLAVFGNDSMLPDVRNVGDIIRAHRVTVQTWNNLKELVGSKRSSFIVLDSCTKESRSTSAKPTPIDDKEVDMLRKFFTEKIISSPISTITTKYSKTLQDAINTFEQQLMIRDQFSSTSSTMDSNTMYFDALCQVKSVGTPPSVTASQLSSAADGSNSINSSSYNMDSSQNVSHGRVLPGIIYLWDGSIDNMSITRNAPPAQSLVTDTVAMIIYDENCWTDLKKMGALNQGAWIKLRNVKIISFSPSIPPCLKFIDSNSGSKVASSAIVVPEACYDVQKILNHVKKTQHQQLQHQQAQSLSEGVKYLSQNLTIKRLENYQGAVAAARAHPISIVDASLTKSLRLCTIKDFLKNENATEQVRVLAQVTAVYPSDPSKIVVVRVSEDTKSSSEQSSSTSQIIHNSLSEFLLTQAEDIYMSISQAPSSFPSQSKGSRKFQAEYQLGLRLEDETGQMEVLICGDQGTKFFAGIEPKADLTRNNTTKELIAQKLDLLSIQQQQHSFSISPFLHCAVMKVEGTSIVQMFGTSLR